MENVIIDRYSHFIKMVDIPFLHKRAVRQYITGYLVEPKLDYIDGRYVQTQGEVYASRTKDDREYRLHVNCLPEFERFLKDRHVPYQVNDLREDIYLGDDAEFTVPDGWTPRDYQVTIKEFLHKPGNRKVVELAMGLGKTATSLSFASEYKKRLCILVLGRYTERWWDDVGKWAEEDRIIEIRGVRDLMSTMEISETPEFRKVSIIIMTITTFMEYIKLYQATAFDARHEMVAPQDVWEVLGVGLRITDETHQHFTQNFIIDLYTHLGKTIYLSATLNPADNFLKRMYQVMFPQQDRAGYGLQLKYTDCAALLYRFKRPDLLRYTNRKKMYNHTEFEKCLMRNKTMFLKPYFEMIDVTVEEDYLKHRKSGQKMLIFFATKKMCAEYVAHLKKKQPKLDVRRYVSEDKYENLLKADVACSTLGSAGTAVDVPNLLVCLMTTALKSEQANLQALGRLRRLNDDTTRFRYLVCQDIPKHMNYHYMKRKLFKEWVLNHRDIFVPVRL